MPTNLLWNWQKVVTNPLKLSSHISHDYTASSLHDGNLAARVRVMGGIIRMASLVLCTEEESSGTSVERLILDTRVLCIIIRTGYYSLSQTWSCYKRLADDWKWWQPKNFCTSCGFSTAVHPLCGVPLDKTETLSVQGWLWALGRSSAITKCHDRHNRPCIIDLTHVRNEIHDSILLS